MPAKFWLALALTCAAWSADATSLRSWDREDPLENPRYESANGRYVLVVRQYPVVPDFESVRVDSVVDFDAEDGLQFPEDGDPETEVAALYDRRKLVSVAKITQEYSNVLVSDSGKRIVVIGTFNSEWASNETLLTIYDARGVLLRSLDVTNAFTPADVVLLRRHRYEQSIEMRLRNDADDGEIVAISFKSIEAVRVRTSDGTLVEIPRDRLPAPRVSATATREPAPRERLAASPEDACFDNVARIASKQLVARATERPLPEFPILAIKVRIRGKVWVEVVVSESGDVICARATQFPFGLREAALESARRWKFTPYEIGGRLVNVTSEIVFHFEDVTPE